METVEDTAIGECALMLSVDDRVLTATVLADCFEVDDERYPEFDLLKAFQGCVEDNLWGTNDEPLLDDAVAESFRKVIATLQAYLDRYPVITPEQKAAIQSQS